MCSNDGLHNDRQDGCHPFQSAKGRHINTAKSKKVALLICLSGIWNKQGFTLVTTKQ